MGIKLFYNRKWMAFEVPEKPVKPKDTFCLTFYMIDMQNYEKAYAEAKANALEVGDVEVIKPVFWEMQSGAEYTWYGSAVIKDGKYILSI